jgi:heme iron utilization protein
MSPQERAGKALELLRSQKSGVLCTHSERMIGFPYGSHAPYALSSRNEPFFFFSGLAVHTKNLQHNANASLLVSENDVSGGRLNLFGSITPVADDGEIAALRGLYLREHPESKQWIDFGDFSFYKLELVNVYWVGGFGEMGWIPAELMLASS